jgi:hypothetical protein
MEGSISRAVGRCQAERQLASEMRWRKQTGTLGAPAHLPAAPAVVRAESKRGGAEGLPIRGSMCHFAASGALRYLRELLDTEQHPVHVLDDPDEFVLRQADCLECGGVEPPDEV